MPRKTDANGLRINPNLCNDVNPDPINGGQRCTKKPGHFPRTQHSNEKPGHYVAWGTPTGAVSGNHTTNPKGHAA